MQQPQPMTPVALYARVSSDRQDIDLSVAAQLRALRDYAGRNGYVVAREYIDEAESGRVADRPQFTKMLDEAAQPDAPFQEILVWKFSRFTRKREHAVAFKSMLRRRGIRVTSITEHADDTPTGKLMEAIIESVDEFYSENLAQEVTRGMREAASRGFWVASRPPYGYKRVKVQDGGKERPTLVLNPPVDKVVRRIFEMASAGQSVLDITRTLNDDGIPTTTGKPWLKTTVHRLLSNEAYTGTLVWGHNAKDGAEPVRVEDAFPAIVTREEFQYVQRLLKSRAPKKANPRRVSSPYLLSGLLGCEPCGVSMSAAEAKGGQYSYYVCQSKIKKGSETCETPRLNARDFERTIIEQLRGHILTERNIRELVKMVDEEIDGLAHEQRRKLETVEHELADVNRALDRIWRLVETTDLEMADAADRIREHKQRKEQLEQAADESRRMLTERRELLDSAELVAAFAEEMGEFPATSELTETRAFLRTFIQGIEVRPGRALIRYTIPMPEDSPIGRSDRAEVGLESGVRKSVRVGGPDWTKSRTDSRSWVAPSEGMGMVYRIDTSSPSTLTPWTKLRISALRSGMVPAWRNSRKSATYRLISGVEGRSARRCSN
ncbi:MAG: recombinase family protein [Chloroflexi bacterium]|nr:recombinase family protein [Chloroflexota bacterium]